MKIKKQKDGELCLSRAKPEETLVEARNDSDVQMDRQTWVQGRKKQGRKKQGRKTLYKYKYIKCMNEWDHYIKFIRV